MRQLERDIGCLEMEDGEESGAGDTWRDDERVELRTRDAFGLANLDSESEEGSKGGLQSDSDCCSDSGVAV